MKTFLIFWLYFVKVVYSYYERCDNSLGLSENKLPNSAFSASSTSINGKHPYYARLNNELVDSNQFLQIDLQKIRQITSISTQGTPNSMEYVSEYYIFYSSDNKTWIVYKNARGLPKLFQGNNDGSTVVRNIFYPPIIAKYIRINPVRWNNLISLRLELYGCDYHPNIVSFDRPYDMIRYNLTHRPLETLDEFIKLRFLTQKSDGVLIHSQGSQGDTLIVTLHKSQLRLYLSMGGIKTPHILTAGNLLDDNLWHDVIIIRENSVSPQYYNITLLVDQTKSSMLITSNYSRLNLDTWITFGAVYDPNQHDHAQLETNADFAMFNHFNQPFIGCMDNIIINDVNIVFQTRKRKSNMEFISGMSYVQKDISSSLVPKNKQSLNFQLDDICKIKKTPTLTFTHPDAYIRWPALQGISALNISCEFRTFHGRGLIAHHIFEQNNALSNSRDPYASFGNGNANQNININNNNEQGIHIIEYLSVYLHEGRLFVKLVLVPKHKNDDLRMNTWGNNKGFEHIIEPFDGESAIQLLNDGIWHYIIIHVRPNELHVELDHRYKSITKRKIDVRTGPYYYIAGGSNQENDSPGFLGCLRSVYLDSRLLPLTAMLTDPDLNKDGKRFINMPSAIVSDTCSIVDRCTPNPCFHGGKCTQDWQDFKCDCINTGYTGAVCLSPIHPPSCHAFRLKGHLYPHSIITNIGNTISNDGFSNNNQGGTPIYIDLDGSGPLEPIPVICSFEEIDSSRTTQKFSMDHSLTDETYYTKTIIGHQIQGERIQVTGYDKAGSFVQPIVYDGLGRNPLHLEFFINRTAGGLHINNPQNAYNKNGKNVATLTTGCTQNLVYECLQAKLMNSPSRDVAEPVSWWVSRTGQPMKHWAGAPVGSGMCACGVTRTCIDPSKYCNCDAFLPDRIERDAGTLTELQHLPVTAIAVGDTGTLIGTNAITSTPNKLRKAFFSLGPLVCRGDLLHNNVVTFKSARAILTWDRPLPIATHGLISFDFRTSHNFGVFFENLGTNAGQDALTLRLLDGNVIRLEFRIGNNNNNNYDKDGRGVPNTLDNSNFMAGQGRIRETQTLTKSLSVHATETLADNTWHSVSLEWNVKELKLQVDHYRPAVLAQYAKSSITAFSSFDLSSTVGNSNAGGSVSGESSDTLFQNLRLTRKLVIGGRSDMTDGYIGCLRMLMINGELIDLVSRVRDYEKLFMPPNTIHSSNDDENDLFSNSVRPKALINSPLGIVIGCQGVCQSNQYPCRNNGTCHEMWSHAICDCAWTAFRGPFCTEDIGTHLKSNVMVKYTFPRTIGTLTTTSEHLRVAFSTLEFQGVLLEIVSYSGDFISLQIQNNGGLKIRFNFGYEPQEINDDRQVYANGQLHEVNVWRTGSGSTIVLQVDSYEPLTKRYETGLSQDTKFDDLKAIYIGRNETTPPGKGFVGCISRVVFEDYFPLKEVFGDPRPHYVSVTRLANPSTSTNQQVYPSNGYNGMVELQDVELIEDMCNVIPETPDIHKPLSFYDDDDQFISSDDDINVDLRNELSGQQQISPLEHIKYGRGRPKHTGAIIAGLVAIIIIILLVCLFIAFFIAKYYTRHKGDYLTYEDAGSKDCLDADTAIMKGPIGQIDTLKKEWFF